MWIILRKLIVTGPARSLGGVIIGYLGARVFNPQPVSKVEWTIKLIGSQLCNVQVKQVDLGPLNSFVFTNLYFYKKKSWLFKEPNFLNCPL